MKGMVLTVDHSSPSCQTGLILLVPTASAFPGQLRDYAVYRSWGRACDSAGCLWELGTAGLQGHSRPG